MCDSEEPTHNSHKISGEVEQDVASDSFSNGREHCQVDKARGFGGEDGVTDCSNSPRVFEKCGLTDLLRQRFGFQQFRQGQLEAITRLLQDRSILCIHPTGFGKSLLYQLPSVLLPGITIVISPLLALMRDQLDHLNKRFKIPAATINTDQTEEENEKVRAQVKLGKIKVLFVAPEQLDHVDRFAFLLNLPVSLVVVDEAHCISTWGHDFRPSYRQIVHYTKALQKKNPSVCVLGLTATANAKTEEDICQQLSGLRPLQVLRESMDRPNIALSVIAAPTLARKLSACAQLVKKLPGCGLIYCSTRENTGIVADFLQDKGVEVRAYHAGLPSETKRELQVAFIQDKYKVVAATNALGMGIDKQNLRFIIHFDVPGSITAYYQEVGRCGRDGKPAQGILVYDPADRKIQEHFIRSAQPKPDDFALVMGMLRNANPFPKLIQIKRETGLHPTLVTVVLAELVEQGFVEKRSQSGSQVYQYTHKQGVPDLLRYDRQHLVRTKELNEMLLYAKQKDGCRMELLRKALGDRNTQSCSHCCICRGSIFTLNEEPNSIQTISRWLEKRVVEIPESKISRISPGIALLDGKLRSPMFVHFMKQRAQTSVDNLGMPEELLALLREQLARIARVKSISAVVPIPSRTWGARDGIATLIAEQLGVPPLLDLLQWCDLPSHRQGELKNNDQRKHNVKERMTVKPEAYIPRGGILLLDDYIGSGATLKEAARVLRKEGGFIYEAVPFIIAQVRWRLGSSGMI